MECLLLFLSYRKFVVSKRIPYKKCIYSDMENIYENIGINEDRRNAVKVICIYRGGPIR